MTRHEEFPYHQGVAPMMWVLFALSLLELVAVHFFVALKWPIVGWPLTILSALAALWLIWWILSFKRLPHVLDDGMLTLRLGAMKNIAVDLGNIGRITSTFEPGALEQKDKINLAAIAHPNRCLELKTAIKGNRHKLYIRLDDPAHFDREMKACGITVQ